MALVLTLRTGGTSAAASFTSTAIATTASSRLIVIADFYRGNGAPTAPTISSAPTLTWTLITSATIPSGTARHVLRAWYTDIASSASTTVTATSTSATETDYVLFDVTGFAAGMSNFISGTAGSGGITVTLPATPAATSIHLTASANAGTGQGVATNPSGFTTVSNQHLTSVYLQVAQDAASAPAAAAWTSSALLNAALSFEIAQSAAAATTSLPLPRSGIPLAILVR